MKRSLALLLALALALSCAACGRGGGSQEEEIPESSGGKDVERAPALDNVFSVNSNSKYSKNPFVATNHANQLICSLVYENMIELDNNFEVVRDSGIISDWKCDDTGKNWELTIEPGHYFSDGTEVMPRDVSYSMGWAINSDRYHGRFASYQGASPGEGVVYVTLGIGDRQFIKLLNLPVIKSGTYGDLGPAGNTPIGSGNGPDDSYIRKACVKSRVPYLTTIAAALASAKGILQVGQGSTEVISLQERHKRIRD